MKFAFSKSKTTQKKVSRELIEETTFSRNDQGVYLISNSGNLGNMAHEVTHAGQILSKKVSLELGPTIPTYGPGVRLMDLEEKAYKATYAVDETVGFKVEGIHDPQFIIKLSAYLNSNGKRH